MNLPAVLLATAQVLVIMPNETMSARALIDQGLEISLISERLVQRLRLPRTTSTVSLIGMGTQKSNQTKGITSFTLKPHFKSDSTFLPISYPSSRPSFLLTALKNTPGLIWKDCNWPIPNFTIPDQSTLYWALIFTPRSSRKA